MKRLFIFCITLIYPLLASAQIKAPKAIAAEAKSKVNHMTMADFKETMKSEDAPLIIDVRTKEEFMAGHIEGALWIPRGRLEFDIQKHTTDPKQKIMVYCRTGGRAALSALALESIGYENVTSLDGGFTAWVEAGESAFNAHGEIKVTDFGKKEKK